MEFKGTKGEWVCIPGNINQLTVIKIGNDHEFELEINGKNKIDKEIANAKLIAAAPELLDLCLLVYNSFGGGNVITFSEKDIEDFKQVIEKALK